MFVQFPPSVTRWALSLALIMYTGLTLGQKTIVTGKITDASTGEPVPFANVVFKDSKIGTISNENGTYRIETYYPTSTLVVSFLGYEPMEKNVKKDVSQVIDFELKVSGIALQAIEIRPDKKDENPADIIMRTVVRNKKANNREKLEAYEYEVYNKIEFDMNNISEEFKNKGVMKPFQFVFDNIDSTSEEKPFLPIFLTESVSHYYYRKSPKSSKEIIEATKVAGVKNESVSQFLGDMYQNTNIYENYVDAFGKSFVSPISDFGMLSYKYYLLDSATLEGKKCYLLQFTPRRKNELVFEGQMWITDTSYAVKQIEATILPDANLNWVKGFKVYHEYDEVEEEVWMLTKEKIVVDFALTDNTMGFYGRKTTTYDNFVINKPRGPNFYNNFNNIEVLEGANEKSNAYWQENRHEKLTESEKNVYQMVDTIRKLPAFRTYVDIITLFVTGYYETKYLDIGPYFTFFSFNQIEGARFRLGGKTNSDFSKKIELNGYLAYGIKDNRFKYSGGMRYFLGRKPRQILAVQYRQDLEQLGTSTNAWRTDNILSSVFRRSPNNQLNGFEEYIGSYEIEYFPGLSNRITINRRDIWPLGTVDFSYTDENGNVLTENRISTAEINLTTRFAYREKFIAGDLDRVSVGTKYPILQTNFALGIKDFIGGEHAYQRLVVNIQDRIPINPIGQAEIVLEFGKIWGTLPYPLLNLHSGNETYFYDAYAFNLMNYYEFVSDQWVSAFYVHHFNGLLLNKIPLMRKLKWRELASFRMAAGDIGNKHLSKLDFPAGLSTLNKPYFEAGVGVENILKIFRVDALWRLSYLNNPDVVPFGIRVAFQLDF